MWDAIVETGIVLYVLFPLACSVVGLAVFAGFALVGKLKKRT